MAPKHLALFILLLQSLALFQSKDCMFQDIVVQNNSYYIKDESFFTFEILPDSLKIGLFQKYQSQHILSSQETKFRVNIQNFRQHVSIFLFLYFKEMLRVFNCNEKFFGGYRILITSTQSSKISGIIDGFFVA